MKNIMIDLETMGTSPRAPIASIGACMFDESGIGETFYQNVDLGESYKQGLCDVQDFIWDGSTVFWWLKRPKAVQITLLADAVHLVDALQGLDQFFVANEPELVWANSPTFDLAILRHAMYVYSLPVRWKYWQERDYRTAMGEARDRHGYKARTLAYTPAGKTKHRAVDDAEMQAANLIGFGTWLKGERDD